MGQSFSECDRNESTATRSCNAVQSRGERLGRALREALPHQLAQHRVRRKAELCGAHGQSISQSALRCRSPEDQQRVVAGPEELIVAVGRELGARALILSHGGWATAPVTTGCTAAFQIGGLRLKARGLHNPRLLAR